MGWIAAGLCLNSTNGGQSDWYLPSIDELDRLYQNRLEVNSSLRTISGATEIKRVEANGSLAIYWSSTENGYSSHAQRFFFDNGYFDDDDKGNSYYVRAVRAF